MKRFAIHPGEVRSQSDGQRHFVSGGELIRRYELSPADCYIVREISGERVDPEWLPLYPLGDGRYKEHLFQIKVSHFEFYWKARKLLVHHESGYSVRRGTMRKQAAERQRKIIARWERQWPDFRAVYDKLEEKA